MNIILDAHEPRVRPEAREIRERLSSGSNFARSISQTNPPPSPFRQSKRVSSEAESAYRKDRIGVMGDLIGKGAGSTTSSLSSKIQVSFFEVILLELGVYTCNAGKCHLVLELSSSLLTSS